MNVLRGDLLNNSVQFGSQTVHAKEAQPGEVQKYLIIHIVT